MTPFPYQARRTIQSARAWRRARMIERTALRVAAEERQGQAHLRWRAATAPPQPFATIGIPPQVPTQGQVAMRDAPWAEDRDRWIV